MLNRTAVVCVVVAAGAAVHADIVEMSLAESGQGMHMLSESDGLALAEGGESLLCADVVLSVELDELALLRPAHPMALGGIDLGGVHEFTPMGVPRAMSIESILAGVGYGRSEASAGSEPVASAAFQLVVLGALMDYDSLGSRANPGFTEDLFSVTGPGQAQLAGHTLSRLDSVYTAVGSGGRFGGMDIGLGAGVVQDRPTAVMADRAIPAPGSAAALGIGVLMAFGRRRR